MTVKLNERAYEYAKRLIEEGKFIDDERDAWSDHHPSTQTENEFIEKNGFSEYSIWFLAVNDEYSEDSRRHYEFSYGDFENVHCCGILAASSRAGQNKYSDVEKAVTDLLAAINKQAHKKSATKPCRCSRSPDSRTGARPARTIACATRCAAPSEWTSLQGHQRND